MARLVVFLMVFEIFNNVSVNSIFKYKLEYKFEYKLGGFDTWELVPDITDYKLEFMTQKFKFRWNPAHRDFRGRKILIWQNYRVFTIMLRHSFWLNLN